MTAAELLNSIYEAGGTVWVSKDDLEDKVTIRQTGAPRNYIQQLRAFPVREVIESIERHDHNLQQARCWLFAQTLPVRTAQTSVESLLRHYSEWARHRGGDPDPGPARQILSGLRIDGGMIDGLMLASDFVAICKDQRRNAPQRLQAGDVVRCEHYSKYPRLIVLQISDEGGDLLVSPPNSQTVFWVVPADCDLLEPVEDRLGEPLSIALGREKLKMSPQRRAGPEI